MTREVEPSPNAPPRGTARTSDLATRAAERIKQWFRRHKEAQLNREFHIRLEEQSRERIRIARELHDTLLQGFLGATMQLHDAVEQLPEESPCKPSLNQALRLIERAVDEGRDTLNTLRSSGIQSVNLEEALSAVCGEFTSNRPEKLRIIVHGQPAALQPAIQEQIYRIAREALVNALRHSGATSIEAEIEYLPRRLRVIVRDNGCGIDPQVEKAGRAAHWGLVGMRERAENIGAQLRIWTRPGAGTEVEISVQASRADPRLGAAR